MRRVYVEFEDHALADRFADALMDWLTEDVVWDASKSPIVYKPRHWFWADADVCAENVHVPELGLCVICGGDHPYHSSTHDTQPTDGEAVQE